MINFTNRRKFIAITGITSGFIFINPSFQKNYYSINKISTKKNVVILGENKKNISGNFKQSIIYI